MTFLASLISCAILSFCIDATCMEQQPRIIRNRTFTISIPQRSNISSDEEESPTSRTSGTPPARISRSGSPLIRLNSRQNNISPRIQQEMLDNPKLSPKEKTLTPRTRLLYDFFGEDFWEESTSPSLSVKNYNSNNSPHTPRLKRQNSRSNSSGKGSHDRLPLSTKFLPKAGSDYTTALNEVSQLISSLADDESIERHESLAPVKMSSTDRLTEAQIKNLSNYSHSSNKQIFPFMFDEKKQFAIDNPCIALQVGMITNNESLVRKCLQEAQEPLRKLHDTMIKATEKLTKAILSNKYKPEHCAAFNKAKQLYLTEIVKLPRPHGTRADLTQLLNCNPHKNEKSKHDYYRGHQVLGLTYILLQAHEAKSMLLPADERTRYMATVGEINTLVWDAFSREKAAHEEIINIERPIFEYLESVRLAGKKDIFNIKNEGYKELKSLIATFFYAAPNE